MKKLCTVLIVISTLLITAGCSIFVSTPREARIEIQGLDNQLHEYIIALDDPTETTLDINLTRRYTIQLDLQWLWDTNETLQLDVENLEEHAIAPLSPWMICKYRF